MQTGIGEEMDVKQPQFIESNGGGEGRIGGTKVKLVKRVREGSGNYKGWDVGGKTGELSSSDGKWGPREESSQTLTSKVDGPWEMVGTPSVDFVRGGEFGAGVKVGLSKVGLFESAAAVGRVGPAYIATGKGGAAGAGGAARGAASIGAGTKVAWASHEGKSLGRGQGAKGKARLTTSSETSPGDDEGYYAHSYGQLAIHREMLQVQISHWNFMADHK